MQRPVQNHPTITTGVPFVLLRQATLRSTRPIIGILGDAKLRNRLSPLVIDLKPSLEGWTDSYTKYVTKIVNAINCLTP